MAGSTRFCQEPEPETGSQPSSIAKNKNQDRSQRKVRKRQPQQRDKAESAVVPAIAMQGRTHSCRNRQTQRHGQRRQRQLQGPGISLRDDVSDILIEAERASHVAVQQAAPVVHVLRAQRDIQPVSMACGGDVGCGRALAQHLLDGIAGHDVNQQEDHRNHQPDDRQHVQQAAEEIAEHHCTAELVAGVCGCSCLDLHRVHPQAIHR